MAAHPASVDEILAYTHQPVVAINRHGLIIYINEAFTLTYGWAEDDLMGRPLSHIIPAHLRQAHERGLARFLATEHTVIAGRAMMLPVLLRTGQVVTAEHFILGEKRSSGWCFAATITLPPTTQI